MGKKDSHSHKGSDNEQQQAADLLVQAGAAAAAAEGDAHKTAPTPGQGGHDISRSHSPLSENVPPPPYTEIYGQVDINQGGLSTGARIADDGRVNIRIQQQTRTLSSLLIPTLKKQLEQEKAEEARIPPGLGEVDGRPPPPMNIVIQIVGSRGDVQPFVALGKVLKQKYNHRVRIATHGTFREFVNDNGLEFFQIGGDPAELMAFMVKNPGLMPGFDSMKSGDVGKRRKGIYEIIVGCWRSCIEAGDGTGIHASDDLVEGRSHSFDSTMPLSDPTLKPFVADAIIANPPSFAHIHVAEKLGIPLHYMFTMPWSPTQMFPHPLANIISSNTDANMANLLSYGLVDLLTWQGLGDVINKFRERSLGLEPLSVMFAPGIAHRLRIPFTYCWSPALIPKPADWGSNIDITGFFFLDLATNYTPPQDLADFLAAGPMPIYIGFGSIVVDDPNAMTKMIFDAVRKTGQRALVSKGWGGLGADELGIPDGVFMLGNCPHDWLFKRVQCVVHHGGAGTTAAGIAHGCPTVIVPFFGDQPFWGAMTAKAGAGPFPIPYKDLDADKLASQILEALKPESKERAIELCNKIKQEKGTESGAESFHKQLHISGLRCSLFPERVAVWRIRRTDFLLSAFAATVLGRAGLLDFKDLKLFRGREYDTDQGGPKGPIQGGAAALIGTLGSISMGVADMPVEILRSLKIVPPAEDSPSGPSSPKKGKGKGKSKSGSASEITSPLASPSEMPAIDITSADYTLEKLSSDSTTGDPEPTRGMSHVDTTASMVPTVADSDMSSVGSTQRHRSLLGTTTTSQHKHLTHTGTVKQVREFTRTNEDQYDVALGGAKAIGRIVSAGVRSPMEFTLGIAKGFHNAPKLYNDDTVRKQDKVTGFQSGLKAAGKEFGYGFYDGITGLVTQPIAGAQKEGAAGFFKGAAKGLGGLILKPGAGIWGIPGYTAKGVYAELTKYFGSSVQNYIIASRTTQGFEEWGNSTEPERQKIIDAWKKIDIENLRKQRKRQRLQHEKDLLNPAKFAQSPMESTDSLTLEHPNKNTTREQKIEQERRKSEIRHQKTLAKQAKQFARHALKENGSGRRSSSMASPSGSQVHLNHSESIPATQHPLTSPRDSSKIDSEIDYEDIIHRTIAASSRGNAEEDAVIERALRLCLPEFEKVREEEHITDDEVFRRAVRSSLEKVKQARLDEQETGVVDKSAAFSSDQSDEQFNRDLELALQRSLTNFAVQEDAHAAEHSKTNPTDSESEVLTSEDEDYKVALSQSKKEHEERESIMRAAGLRSHDSQRSVETVVHRGLPTPAHSAGQPSSHNTDVDDEDDPDFQRALKESQRLAGSQQHSHHTDSDDDAEYQRILKESQEEHERKNSELQKHKTEEDIVMEYVKKQSMLEHKYSQDRQKPGVANP